MFGEEVIQDVEAGRHHLRVSNTLFWKTVDFDVKPGEHVRFDTINRAGRLSYAMLGFLGVGPLYLTVRRAALTSLLLGHEGSRVTWPRSSIPRAVPFVYSP
jgi:hypothetical protein